MTVKTVYRKPLPPAGDHRQALGTFIKSELAPDGSEIVVVKCGPNPHEVRHYDATTVDVVNEEPPWGVSWPA